MSKISITPSLVCSVCIRLSEMPQASNAAVRTAVWMIGVAHKAGGFPLDLSLRQIGRGFTKDGRVYKGTGSRIETIKASVEWLEKNGFLDVSEGAYSGFGFHSKNYTIKG